MSGKRGTGHLVPAEACTPSWLRSRPLWQLGGDMLSLYDCIVCCDMYVCVYKKVNIHTRDYTRDGWLL